MDKTQIYTETLAKLEVYLIEHQITNTQFAKMVGVEAWTVGAWRSKQRKISSRKIHLIAEILNNNDPTDRIGTMADTLIREIQACRPHQIPQVAKALTRIQNAYFDLTFKALRKK